MNISFKLQSFEGPLDLLLYLIEKNKVNIYDIPVAEITAQYLNYIKTMKEENLDVVSEFLVMAATLIGIKSKMLLPAQNDDEVADEDPRAELVEKLLEYKYFKYISCELKEKHTVASKSIIKPSTLPQEIKDYEAPIDLEELVGDLTLSRLNDIFLQVIRKQGEKIDIVRSKFGKIQRDEVSTSDKIEVILSKLTRSNTFSFRSLLMEQCSKLHIIVTFLAVLELMKTGMITICQTEIFDDITIQGVK